MSRTPLLLAVPNVSEGRDRDVVDAIAHVLGARTRAAATGQAGRPPRSTHQRAGDAAGQLRLLDVHCDADHNRSVLTFAARQGQLAEAMLRVADAAVKRVDVMNASSPGQHPYVGALDVAPIVYLAQADRGAACAEALVVGDRIGTELSVPVFLYGELAEGRTRAELRRGGPRGLGERMSDGRAPQRDDRLVADFGPARLHPSAGATLVTAREPLVAFNLVLAAPAGVERACTIAAAIRDGAAEGLPGVRAIGVEIRGGAGQVSMNIERPLEVPLGVAVEAVSRHAPVASAEIVGLVPRAALEGFPEDVPLPAFDPERHVIENALRSLGGADKT